MDISHKVELCVKENFQSVCFRSINNISHLTKLEFKPFSNFLVVVCLIKLGISFDKVEDSVHCLISMQAILRKSVI